jgi:hypothetical protein
VKNRLYINLLLLDIALFALSILGWIVGLALYWVSQRALRASADSQR